MNKIILIGNLTRDPELSQTPNGTSVCKFSIAVNRNYANANGEREVDFINIVAWRGCADNCGKYLHKGSKVAICGSLQTRTYQDKNDVKRTITEVVAEDVEFIGGNNNNGVEPKQTAQMGKKKAGQLSLHDLSPQEQDELPF